ncbi:hypothetical protein AMEX_G9302 [Astyanax mexicanus]|uniref:Translin-associated factor X-interacting protein 1 N-terminal domain-containing protein n=1 Tax=Astyanax mexicanus TaxID=7994 RepID=A0A8B9KBH0_ASTMX|nr:hypothetical protein AMEX_G9302 [Astyanax mexicanus]
MQRSSGIRRELKELLLSVERGNKADLHLYTSGHLGPHSFSPRPLHGREHKPIWEKSRNPQKETSRLQKSRETEADVEKMMQAWSNFTMATTPQDPAEDLSSSDETTGVGTYKKKKKKKKKKEEEVRETADLDLISHKRLNIRETVERHERKIQQGLRNVPACRGRCRERLSVFSDVFSDVCDSSPALGSILREIKTEYDLYLNSITSSLTSLQDLSVETAGLQAAVELVCLLEEEERRALEENERARTEYNDAQAEAKAMSIRLEKGKEIPTCVISESESGGLGLPDVEFGVFPDEKPSNTQASSMTQVEEKTQQVWRMWREVQSLQKDLRETMVSTVTASSLTGFIRDTKAEIMHLIAWNERLKSTSKDLEQNISESLSRANVSEEMEEKVWEMLWNTVDGD